MKYNRDNTATIADNISTYADKAGAPPETLIYTGDFCQTVNVHAFGYGPDRWMEMEINETEELEDIIGYPVTWINIDGVCDVEIVKSICNAYNIHPMVQEDILHTGQRPKIEEFENYVFCVLKMISYDRDEIQVSTEQISLILLENTVISFQEKPGTTFDLIRNRLRSGKSKICNFGSDYLLYSLLDAIVDNYFLTLEEIGDQVDDMEEDMLHDPDGRTEQVYLLKRELLVLRRSIWPVREMINRLDKTESHLINDSLGIYLRDIYDHVVHAIDSVENLRDMMSGIIDSRLSSASYRMGEVMKVLTVISTIFIPLTFITGVYGMNFSVMPERDWKYGYAAVWVVMIAIAGAMLAFFRKRKWF